MNTNLDPTLFASQSAIMASFTSVAQTAPEIMRILIADGNATVRKLLRHSLDASRWEVIEVENGEEAVQSARDLRPHLILLERNLSRLNGPSVCRQLKSDLECKNIPIVMMTSAGNSEEINEAVDAGADEFISKPINRAELSVRLRSLTRVHRFNQEMVGAESMALALARAVASKDGYSSGHVEQVANFAVSFGEYLKLDTSDLKILKYGAILHNVGKIAIPDSILEKTGPLTPRERALFQQHPRVGCDICAPLKPLVPCLPIIRHHKEHWDGTGYPDGLRGNDIPLGAQIVGIVDVYSALTNDRPFRRAKSHIEATAILHDRALRGIHSPELIQSFISSLGDAGNRLPAFAADPTLAQD